MNIAHREELVEVKTEDGLEHAGLVIRPDGRSAHPIGVLWIHGGGVNFYLPPVVRIGRHLSQSGFVFVTGNNRGHDFGSVVGWAGEHAIRGGVAWEIVEDAPRDIRAWLSLMVDELGLQGVALIGHSFGAIKVTSYQAQHQDTRVLGLGLASTPMLARHDPAVVSLAEALVADGRGDEPLPWKSVPMLVGFATFSASTYLSRMRIGDMYGVGSANPPVARVQCPIFACFGSDDLGGATELETIRRNAISAERVETAIFEGADHGYEFHEPAVAAALGGWISTLV